MQTQYSTRNQERQKGFDESLCPPAPSESPSTGFDHASQVFWGRFADLRPAGLPIYVPPTCRFTSDQIRPNVRNHSVNPHLRQKTAATILYILSYSLAPALHIPHVHTYTTPFFYFSSILLTLPVFILYNVLTFDSHGLIRRLGRLLSGPVSTLLILLSTPRHMLSLEMGSTVGVAGLSVELNDAS